MSHPYDLNTQPTLPIDYKYYPFSGLKYIRGFFLSRSNTIQLLELDLSHNVVDQNVMLLLRDYYQSLPQTLVKPSLDMTVHTKELLSYLILNPDLTEASTEEADLWLRRLIQRFEVSKVIFESYMPRFRKGYGNSKDLDLYVLFSALLVNAYSCEPNLQYLSTLLKLCDHISCTDISTASSKLKTIFNEVLIAERSFIQSLALNHGVNFNA